MSVSRTIKDGVALKHAEHFEISEILFQAAHSKGRVGCPAVGRLLVKFLGSPTNMSKYESCMFYVLHVKAHLGTRVEN